MNLSREDEEIWEMRLMENEDSNGIASEDAQNKLIPSFIPDEIINNFDDFTPNENGEEITSSRCQIHPISTYPILGIQDVLTTLHQQPLDKLLDLPANQDTASDYDSFVQPSAVPVPSTSKQYDTLTVTLPSASTERTVSINSDKKLFKRIWDFCCVAKPKNRNLRDFTNKDFHLYCESLPFSTTRYSQLITHYNSLGNWSKLLDVLLEYADASIRSSNLELALTILEEALDVLDITPQTDLARESNLIRGKIYSLLGYVYLELDQFDEAELKLQMALEQYGRKFPYSKLSGKLKTLKLSLKQKMLSKKKLSHWKSYICNNVSEILSHFATLFMKRNQWEYAELAACWSLSKALKASNDFKILCTSYSNMLTVATHYKCFKQIVALEDYALALCNKKLYMEQEDLKAVIKLYSSIFWSALSHAELNKAKQIGDIALRTAISIRATELVAPILPMLMYTCLLANDVPIALQILDELQLLVNCKSDDGQTRCLWYLAQCMAIYYLETGNTKTCYDDCEKMAKEYFLNNKDEEAVNYYCVTMWLWCIRHRDWTKATFWHTKIKEFRELDANDGIVNQLSRLHLLEGLITTLAYKIDDNNDKNSWREIEKEIERLIKTLEKSAKHVEMILPRLFHMKAFYRAVRYNDGKVLKYLEKSDKLAAKYKNSLEQQRVMDSLKGWNITVQQGTKSKFWQEHFNEQTECNKKQTGYLALPLPTPGGDKLEKVLWFWDNNEQIVFC